MSEIIEGAEGEESWFGGFVDIDGDSDRYDGLSKFENPQSLADSYINLEKLVGKDVMPIPNLDDEGSMDDIYSQLGRPENSSDYSFGEDSKIEVDEDFAKVAHEIGLSSKQFSKLGKWYEGFASKSVEQQQLMSETEIQKNRKNLEKEWGNDFEKNSNIINRILDDIPDNDLKQSVEDKFSNDVDFAKFMKHISEKVYKEDGSLIQGGNDDQVSIQDEIDSLTSSKAYFNKNDPLHESSVRKVRELYVKLENRR